MKGVAYLASLPASKLRESVDSGEVAADALLRDVRGLHERLVTIAFAGKPTALLREPIDSTPELVASGKLLESTEFRSRLGWSAAALSKAKTTHRVFSVESKGKTFFPEFFADHSYERKQLESVAKALGTLPGGAKWLFFTTPKASLGGHTPLEALAVGRVEEAMRAAQGFADR